MRYSNAKVTIIGIGDEGRDGISPAAAGIIEKAELLFGGERHLSFFPSFSGEKVAIKGNLKEVTERISREREKRVVVLASGDPNFYGIARTIVEKIGKDSVEILPAVSSMQLAFARIKEPWDDAYLASVHARPIENIIDAARSERKIGLFTDDKNTPAKVASTLLSNGIADCRVFVCENLGGEGERITETTLAQLQKMSFGPLNVMILIQAEGGKEGQKPDTRKGYTFGIPEEEFVYRKPKMGLITKTEVRVISLSKMRLAPDSIVWDIGAGSGSVSIESALLATRGKVYAIEKNEEDVGLIRQNIEKFGTENVVLLHTTAPEGLAAIDPPNAVFIGGSGSKMQSILEVAWGRLHPGGSLVANLATIENLSEAYGYFKNRGIPVDITLVQIGRSSPILELTRFEALNPVYILHARKDPFTGKNEEGTI